MIRRNPATTRWLVWIEGGGTCVDGPSCEQRWQEKRDLMSSVPIRDRYAARNAAIPSLAGFSIALAFVVAGSIVTEQVFSYPGIGKLMIQSVQGLDYTLMQGVFLVITLTVLAANFAMDLLYGLIDPRVRNDI